MLVLELVFQTRPEIDRDRSKLNLGKESVSRSVDKLKNQMITPVAVRLRIGNVIFLVDDVEFRALTEPACKCKYIIGERADRPNSDCIPDIRESRLAGKRIAVFFELVFHALRRFDPGSAVENRVILVVTLIAGSCISRVRLDDFCELFGSRLHCRKAIPIKRVGVRTIQISVCPCICFGVCLGVSSCMSLRSSCVPFFQSFTFIRSC